jgi:Domain of unknown function (DUF5625)
MMARKGRMLAWPALIGAGVLAAATLWAFAREPILRRMYGDVPRLEFPTDLDKSLEFRARILDKRNYWLDLLVYYDNKDQRAAVEQIVGLYRGTEKTFADFGVPTQFHVVIRDDRGRIIREENRAVVGMNGFTSHYRVRRIDEFILSPGIYFIQVTPVGDFSAFRGFRAAFELMSYPKATPIRD